MRERLVEMIGKESQRLNGLVQAILDLARLEREGDILNRAETDLGEVVADVVETMRPQAEAKGIALTVAEHPESPVMARVDAQLVSQALTNLVVNAIRYSGSKDVVLSLAVSDGRARITVEDHGVGIPAEHRAHIFERFYRGDVSRTAETGGAGLGLAIVRQIARLHGGDAVLEPVSPSGCRFALSLTLA